MTKKSQKPTAAVKDYVTVAFAEDMELAREYKAMLDEHHIPAVVKNIGRSQEQGSYSGIAIMVPEEFLDEAYELISEEASFDDFFDAAFSEHEHNEHDISFYDDEDDDLY